MVGASAVADRRGWAGSCATSCATPTVDFGDTRLFFRDMAAELARPFYPEVGVGHHAARSPTLLAATDSVGDYTLLEPADARSTRPTGDVRRARPTRTRARPSKVLARRRPAVSQRSIPTRPPTSRWSCTTATPWRSPRPTVSMLGGLHGDDDERRRALPRAAPPRRPADAAPEPLRVPARGQRPRQRLRRGQRGLARLSSRGSASASSPAGRDDRAATGRRPLRPTSSSCKTSSRGALRRALGPRSPRVMRRRRRPSRTSRRYWSRHRPALPHRHSTPPPTCAARCRPTSAGATSAWCTGSDPARRAAEQREPDRCPPATCASTRGGPGPSSTPPTARVNGWSTTTPSSRGSTCAASGCASSATAAPPPTRAA
jgi:hypothetical protein